MTKFCSGKNHLVFSRALSLILLFALALPLLFTAGVSADLIENATVIVSSANIRRSPGTAGDILVCISRGQRAAVGNLVTIAGDPRGYDSWYEISLNYNGTRYDGYIVSSFIQKDPTAVDPDFETSIAAFPESYRQSLRSLHEAHPNWTFKAVNIGTNWSDVISAESAIGTSLIHSSVNDAWKSTDSLAYSWMTNTYTPYDGTAWVNASKEIVAYYLDPRNFLSETYIFQFLSLAYDSATQTQDAVQKILDRTFMSGLLIADMDGAQVSYAQTFMNAGELSGSSPYQLVSRVIQEVSANGSRSTSGTETGYEGYYNFYNIGASSAADPVILGLTFAKYGSSYPNQYQMSAENKANYLIPWNSPYRSIVGGAAYISENYIQKGQNTLYFQKFDVTDDGNGVYRHQYMTNIQAMTGESTTLYNAYAQSSILDLPLTFNIPVYLNMSDTASPLPAQTGNPNNYLSQLSVDGYILTPTFDPATADGYSLIVPYETSQITISALPVASTSSVSGAGAKALNVGENDIPIAVTAQNETRRTYTISVVRNAPAGETLFTTSFRINDNGTMAGIEPGTTIAGLTAGITLMNGAQMDFLTPNGTVISDPAHLTATGDRIRILRPDGTAAYEYSMIVYGDASGDGKITSSDLTIVSRHVLQQSQLTGTAVLAADANHDGKISSSDLTIISRHVLKQSTITQ